MRCETSNNMPTADWNYEIKPGEGYPYDDEAVEYDEILDLQQNLQVYYDRLGDESVWTNETI